MSKITKAKADAQAKREIFVALSKHCARLKTKTNAIRRDLKASEIASDLALRDVMAVENILEMTPRQRPAQGL